MFEVAFLCSAVLRFTVYGFDLCVMIVHVAGLYFLGCYCPSHALCSAEDVRAPGWLAQRTRLSQQSPPNDETPSQKKQPCSVAAGFLLADKDGAFLACLLMIQSNTATRSGGEGGGVIIL